MAKPKDLRGQKFGKLTPIERTQKKGNDKSYLWVCSCECGNTILATVQSLTSGHKRSCGCIKRIDLIGKKFGSLTPIKFIPKLESPNGRSSWLCRCDCGNEIIVEGGVLRDGFKKHCGCESHISYGEERIQNILQSNNIVFQREVTFSDLINPLTNKHLRYDFAIYKDNKIIKLIEFDGRQHSISCSWDNKDPLEQRQQRDKIKNEYAKKHHIPLLRIPYWKIEDINLEFLLGEEFCI